jgi:hypothetical protein
MSILANMKYALKNTCRLSDSAVPLTEFTKQQQQQSVTPIFVARLYRVLKLTSKWISVSGTYEESALIKFNLTKISHGKELQEFLALGPTKSIVL